MKLQLALDRLTKEECIQLIQETYDYIDWIEIGTSVIKEYGMQIIREIREMFPEKTIVADMKTCDAGGFEAAQAFKAGADITTVMAFSSDLTILDTLKVGREYNKRIMVDLLEVSTRKRMKELEDLKVDLVSLHVGKDKQQTGTFNTELFSLVDSFDFEVSVAGGINLDSLPEVVQEKPDIIIVGSAITSDLDPKEAARKMKEII